MIEMEPKQPHVIRLALWMIFKPQKFREYHVGEVRKIIEAHRQGTQVILDGLKAKLKTDSGNEQLLGDVNHGRETDAD